MTLSLIHIFGDIDESTEVLVIDSETRPMPAAQAYDAVKNITGWALSLIHI